ncbi:MAG: T9SS type A sorting domain-containing protein, partial [Bacteroidales bacterium]|nr:T9SS type A sorting domain-containing protein [Bacteroidales bacterium]
DYACNPTPTPSAIPFYSYGRANIIKVLQWRTAGDYKLIAKLQKRTGGTGWGGQGYCPADGTVGGHESTIAPMIYDTAEFYFHVIQGAGPVMPLIDIHALEGPTSNDETINEVAIYPNPARDYFTIELTGFEGQTNVLLSNSEGAVVERLDVNVDENTRIIRVNTRDYAQGVYVVTARNNDVIITKRVVIIR